MLPHKLQPWTPLEGLHDTPIVKLGGNSADFGFVVGVRLYMIEKIVESCLWFWLFGITDFNVLIIVDRCPRIVCLFKTFVCFQSFDDFWRNTKT